MFKNVKNRMKTTGYDYDQSGVFQEIMDGEGKGISSGNLGTDTNPKVGRSSVTVGFGNVGSDGELNLKESMRRRQTHTMRKASGGYISFDTKAESQMPKWILMEFGRSGSEQTADKVPKQFQLPYTRRSDKSKLVGSSNMMQMYTEYDAKNNSAEKRKSGAEDKGMLRHYDNVGAKKLTFVMATPEVANYMKYDAEHPGIRPGRFFRHGLDDSKLPVANEYGHAIEQYLRRISAK
jgi:hypothetical protein